MLTPLGLMSFSKAYNQQTKSPCMHTCTSDSRHFPTTSDSYRQLNNCGQYCRVAGCHVVVQVGRCSVCHCDKGFDAVGWANRKRIHPAELLPPHLLAISSVLLYCLSWSNLTWNRCTTKMYMLTEMTVCVWLCSITFHLFDADGSESRRPISTRDSQDVQNGPGAV